MTDTNHQPWHFTIVFDEEKARRNGYDVDELYDCVGRYVEPRGNVRTGRGSWQAKSREVQFGAQIPTKAVLAKQDWVMEHVVSWTSWEDDPEGHDFLAILREVRPELIRN